MYKNTEKCVELPGGIRPAELAKVMSENLGDIICSDINGWRGKNWKLFYGRLDSSQGLARTWWIETEQPEIVTWLLLKVRT